MTHALFTIARHRTLISTLSALVLAASLSHASLAATDEGLWKVNPTKSSLNASSATLSIDRVAGAVNPVGSSFIAISNGNVYRITPAAGSASKGAQPVDYPRMMKKGEAVLIGSKAHTAEPWCNFRCQANLPEPHLTLTFSVAKGAEGQINDMLAQGK